MDGPKARRAFHLTSKQINELLQPWHFKLTGLNELAQLKPYVDAIEARTRSASHRQPLGQAHDDSKRLIDVVRSCLGVAQLTVLSASSGDSSPSSSAEPGDIVMQYPLSDKQLEVLKLCWKQARLVFTDLPTSDQVIKLIALSQMVTSPFYGQRLFPNVKSVVYGGRLHSQSMKDRYEKKGGSLRHPLAFAPDWLVGNFQLCLHYASIPDQHQWITDLVKILISTGQSEPHEAKLQAHKMWTRLDSFDYIFQPRVLRQLQRVRIHDARAGLRLRDLDLNVPITIEFGLLHKSYMCGAGGTVNDLVSMARQQGRYQKSRIQVHRAEHILMTKPPGPKAKYSRADYYAQICRLFQVKVEGQPHQPIRWEHETDQLVIGRLCVSPPLTLVSPCKICGEYDQCDEPSCKEDSMSIVCPVYRASDGRSR